MIVCQNPFGFHDGSKEYIMGVEYHCFESPISSELVVFCDAYSGNSGVFIYVLTKACIPLKADTREAVFVEFGIKCPFMSLLSWKSGGTTSPIRGMQESICT